TDPGRFRRSTTATRFPCEASDQAKDLALPLPSTTTSYSSGFDTFSPFELIPRVNFLPASHRQHDPEARLAAHHAVVGLGGPFQGVHFVHRTDTGLDAERQRVLRVDGRAGVPALDGPAASAPPSPIHQLQIGDRKERSAGWITFLLGMEE